MLNGLSIDVEEYFQVEAAAHAVPPSAWDHWPSRVERGVDRLLELLVAHRVHATFFILGWVAERHAALVRRIAAAGHEVASHGYLHQHLDRLSSETFRSDVRRAKGILEGLAGAPVEGYRAPTFSIGRRTAWALDVLVEEGFRYDSSIFPVRHDRYGTPSAPRRPYVIDRPGGRLAELPLLTARLCGQNLPMAGGGYLRLLPAEAVRWAVRQMNRAGAPAILYLHPWEVDLGQPRLPLSRLATWRHRVGLSLLAAKLAVILRSAAAAGSPFGPLRPLAAAVRGEAHPTRPNDPLFPEGAD